MSTQKNSSKVARKAPKSSSQAPVILLGAGIGIAVLVIVIFLVRGAVQPAAASAAQVGDIVPITSRQHVPAGTPLSPYNSNPPAGGEHYPTTLGTKFYEESDLATLPKYPEGYLVHNLEHGYVIFWYNCAVAGTDCASLKQTIQKVMSDAGGVKLIAFPWSSLDVPLALTSWGRIQKFKSADPAAMSQFVAGNRYQAPEPDAP